ncbi:UNVERIFIED_CONTAM: hypothetical protein RMT77_003975 [Armadillidium vulgare]
MFKKVAIFIYLIIFIKPFTANYTKLEKSQTRPPTDEATATTTTTTTINSTTPTTIGHPKEVVSLDEIKSTESEETSGISPHFKYAHMGSSMGIPVGEALDPPLCPPPPLTRSLGICYLKKCSNHHDCEKGEACCFNGCILSCIKPMDQPAAFDWVEDTDRVLPILELDMDDPATHFVPIPMHNQTPQYEEALSGGELVHLPGGCFISASKYEDLKEFMKAPSIKACRCNEGEVVCDVRNEKS